MDVGVLGLRNQHGGTSRLATSLYRYQSGLSNHFTPGYSANEQPIFFLFYPTFIIEHACSCLKPIA
jgi:hypothetical protein